MIDINERPKTINEAYFNGLNCHTEGQNPFRNCNSETFELNNAWYRGFEEANPECKD